MCESIEEQFNSLIDWLEDAGYYKALDGVYELLDKWAKHIEKSEEEN